MIKYADNTFHALKVSFANEIGSICGPLEIDSHKVMDIFCQDKKLNISEYYLKPGFAFGGSCLPKDLRALTYRAKELDVALPLLNAVLPSNEEHLERAVELVLRQKQREVALVSAFTRCGRSLSGICTVDRCGNAPSRPSSCTPGSSRVHSTP